MDSILERDFLQTYAALLFAHRHKLLRFLRATSRPADKIWLLTTFTALGFNLIVVYSQEEDNRQGRTSPTNLRKQFVKLVIIVAQDNAHNYCLCARLQDKRVQIKR